MNWGFLKYLLLGLVIAIPGTIFANWPIYGDYWMQHGFWGVIQRDVVGHEVGMLVAVLLGIGYIGLEHYGSDAE